ncbi:hypothetical protein niasHT_013940 [Heterodera trifolii]|uniref:PAZ domain-containing protein n=1 Tax=Heterodera trifolii TaxID=157864 RepID=A0ABD2L1Q9_9BILA
MRICSATMVLVIEFCAKILGCSPKSLRDKLNHPEDRVKALKELVGKKVRTTYQDRNGMQKTFFVDGISDKGAALTPAYGRLRQPYNINIAAHFYARHRIKLHLPYVPCIVEKYSGCGEDRYYPMELLEIVDEDYTIKERWLGKLFTEIEDIPVKRLGRIEEVEEIDDNDDGGGRYECSQPSYVYW